MQLCALKKTRYKISAWWVLLGDAIVVNSFSSMSHALYSPPPPSPKAASSTAEQKNFNILWGILVDVYLFISFLGRKLVTYLRLWPWLNFVTCGDKKMSRVYDVSLLEHPLTHQLNFPLNFRPKPYFYIKLLLNLSVIVSS